MAFLYPLYLLGALAIGIPILLHLRRRPPQKRVEFSSLMFLEPHPPARKSRSRPEDLVLLALRCLAVLLLAALFARPFWRDALATAEAGQGALRVILIDRSASMRRAGLWQEAQKAVLAELARSRPTDRVSILAFGAGTEVLVDFGDWERWPVDGRVAAAQEKTRSLEPGWQATGLGRALVAALGLLEDQTAGRLRERRAEVVVVSDWQSGADLTALEGFSWPDSVTVRRAEVQPPGGARSNAALHLAGRAAEEPAEGGREPADASLVRVRVTNGAGSIRERFRLGWEDGDAGSAVDVVLPPGGTRVVMAPPRKGGEAGLRLEGDEEAFDNRIFVAPDEPRAVRVLYVAERLDEEDTAEPFFYLSRALSRTETLAPQIVARRTGELAEADLTGADVLVLGGEAPEARLEGIEQFLQRGGTVWLPLREGMDAARLPVLRGWGVKLREVKPDDYALWSGLDFQDTLLRPFAPAPLRDFSKIRVWRYREVIFPAEVPGGVNVLARYDKGGAALLVASVGKGQLFVLPGGWLPRDSQLALSSKFVPLLYAMLRQAGFESDARRQFFAGDRLPGGAVAVEPGLISLKGAEAGRREGSTVAVNLPVAESDLEPLDEGTLAGLGLVVAVDAPGGFPVVEEEETRRERERLHYLELEGQQQLWRWLVLVVVVILLAETWLSGRMAVVAR